MRNTQEVLTAHQPDAPSEGRETRHPGTSPVQPSGSDYRTVHIWMLDGARNRRTKAMSSPYDRGRPYSHKLNPAPAKPGYYGWNNPDGTPGYIGETCDLKRRLRQHGRKGSIPDGCDPYYKAAKDGMTV